MVPLSQVYLLMSSTKSKGVRLLQYITKEQYYNILQRSTITKIITKEKYILQGMLSSYYWQYLQTVLEMLIKSFWFTQYSPYVTSYAVRSSSDCWNTLTDNISKQAGKVSGEVWCEGCIAGDHTMAGYMSHSEHYVSR